MRVTLHSNCKFSQPFYLRKRRICFLLFCDVCLIFPRNWLRIGKYAEQCICYLKIYFFSVSSTSSCWRLLDCKSTKLFMYYFLVLYKTHSTKYHHFQTSRNKKRPRDLKKTSIPIHLIVYFMLLWIFLFNFMVYLR